MNHPILRWLMLGITALAVAGVFAFILVVARTPQLAAFGDLFSVALVVHVDLSVLMWFLCIGCMGWAGVAHRFHTLPPFWATGGFWVVAAATACIALSPLAGHWEVVKSNYIPVLNNFPFLLGLGLLAAGLLVVILPVLPVALSPRRLGQLNGTELMFTTAAVTTLLALVMFFLSESIVPKEAPATPWFEILFWSGGHVLQFTFGLLMIAGWLALADALAFKPVKRWLINIVALICFGAAVKTALGFFTEPLNAADIAYFDTSAFAYYQTRVMIELGGMGAGIVALVLGAKLAFSPTITRANRAYAATLGASLLLFMAGGMLGLMIKGQNVIIPAHYHGAIVGITLALMGYAYTLLPKFGYPSVAGWRLAFWQPIVYAIGQLMHIGGLAYSGGYGVLRKTPAGDTPNLAPDVKAALGFMGLGGMLAIIGGLLFVVVMVKVLRMGRRGSPAASV